MVSFSRRCGEDDSNTEIVVDEDGGRRAADGFEGHLRFHSVYDSWDRWTKLVDCEREL